MLVDGLILTEGSSITNLAVASGATLPTENLDIGELFFNTDTQQLMVYTTSGWSTVQGGSSGDITPESIGAVSTDVVGAASGVASLDSSGKIPTAQLPALALTDVFSAASGSAMVSLSAQEGDICIRTDLSKTYVHNGGSTGTSADWSELLNPASSADHGTLSGLSDDDHTQYALANGTRGNFAATNHNHNTAYAALSHNHDGTYATSVHTHIEYSVTSHNHDGAYATASHNHTGVYEPADVTILKEADIGVTVQGKLVAGANIDITDDTISASVDTSTALNWSVPQTFSKAIFEKYVDLGVDAEIDLEAGGVFYKLCTGNVTFTLQNIPPTGIVASFILEIANGGSNTITWFDNIKWDSGIAPGLSVEGIDSLGFYTYNNGTTWRGIVLAKDVK
jgi:hypothetical protein